MRKTLEDFYYGNIVPCERQMEYGSELKKAADRVARYTAGHDPETGKAI